VAELGGEHYLVPAAGENFAEGEFGAAVRAVHLGGVEERDARVDGRVHYGARAGHVETPAEVVAAEAHDGYEQPRVTEGSIAHDTHHTERLAAATTAGRAHSRPCRAGLFE